MKLYYKDNFIECEICKSFFSRLKGFMFTKNITYAKIFNNCNSIHTFNMLSNIDVIMCDRDNKILYYYNNLTKNKIIFPKKNVYKVIELPVNYFDIKINEKIRME